MALEPREIGQMIAAARKARGWTQVVFALNIGVSPSTVQRWEAGQVPPVRELLRVGRLLGIPGEELRAAVTGPPEDRLDRIEAMLEEVREMLLRIEGRGHDGANRPPATATG